MWVHGHNTGTNAVALKASQTETSESLTEKKQIFYYKFVPTDCVVTNTYEYKVLGRLRI